MDIELMNLVTTKLVQEKKEVEYELRGLVGEDTPEHPAYQQHVVGNITETLHRYSSIINQIQLWESLLDEMTSPNEDDKEKKEN